ncbi:MAG: hemerythrin domain-containing protein [Gemmatimonadales bacterium]
MESIDVLMAEHRLIERVLDATESAAGRLERGATVRAGFFEEVVEFLIGFADGCHHHKEEDVLFPAMVRAGLPRDEGPIAVMLAEHEQGRALVRAIGEGAAALGSGDSAAAGGLVAAVRGYVALLRAHIQKEDQILFPMAAQLLSAEAEHSLIQGFDRVEREDVAPGGHTRLHDLAAALVREGEAVAQ